MQYKILYSGRFDNVEGEISDIDPAKLITHHRSIEQMINQALVDGWVLHGDLQAVFAPGAAGTHVGDVYFYQAVTKE
jgi:hypothetical protein